MLNNQWFLGYDDMKSFNVLSLLFCNHSVSKNQIYNSSWSINTSNPVICVAGGLKHFSLFKQMVLLLLGDSQCERIWPTVRLDREVLRDAIFYPVKNRASVLPGYKSITSAVSINNCEPSWCNTLVLAISLKTGLISCAFDWGWFCLF